MPNGNSNVLEPADVRCSPKRIRLKGEVVWRLLNSVGTASMTAGSSVWVLFVSSTNKGSRRSGCFLKIVPVDGRIGTPNRYGPGGGDSVLASLAGGFAAYFRVWNHTSDRANISY